MTERTRRGQAALPWKLEQLRQSWPRPSRPRPIVCIGAGGIVRGAQLPAYREAGLAVAGVYDRSRGTAVALARDFGLPRVFETLAEATLQRGVLFDLAVPAEQILPVLRALPRRSVVLIQKPMGRDLAEARRIARLCKERSLLAAINFQLRFAPGVLALRDALERGWLGKIVDFELRTRTFTPWERWDFLEGSPRLELLYHSVHALDLSRALLGDPSSVLCRADRDPRFARHADTRAAVLLQYASGARATLVTAHSHEFGPQERCSKILIEGTQGAACYSMGVNLEYGAGLADELAFAARGSSWQTCRLRASWFPAAFEGSMFDLQSRACADVRVLENSLGQGLRTMALVEACYRSSRRPGTKLPPSTLR